MTWQVGAALAAVLAIFGFGYYCGTLKGKAQVEAMQASSFKALADAYQAQQVAAQAKETSYEKEIAELQGSILTEYPTVAVRVCDSASSAVSKTVAGGQKLPASTGLLPANPVADRGPGRDIGPSLFQLADEADRIVAECREQ